MNRTGVLVIAMVLLFVAVVLILNQMLPGAHRPTDYLVIGGAATMVCLLVLFGILLATAGSVSSAFFSRRKKR